VVALDLDDPLLDRAARTAVPLELSRNGLTRIWRATGTALEDLDHTCNPVVIRVDDFERGVQPFGLV
jgi:hypothetical protein